jgi:hypothetical protein
VKPVKTLFDKREAEAGEIVRPKEQVVALPRGQPSEAEHYSSYAKPFTFLTLSWKHRIVNRRLLGKILYLNRFRASFRVRDKVRDCPCSSYSKTRCWSCKGDPTS